MMDDTDTSDEIQQSPLPSIPSLFDIKQLPASFQSFLNANAIDPKIYTVDQLPRYVRWNTHMDPKKLPTLDQLKEQLKTEHVWHIPGMKGFFGIRLNEQQQPRLVDIPAYQQRAIFGIDLSSAIAVEALTIQPDDHVLDLCCAPGAKLCMISNVIGMQGIGTVTGVDIASHRLATCRSLVKKYQVGSRIRLYEADGTTFDTKAPTRLGAILLPNHDETPCQHSNNSHDDNNDRDNRGTDSVFLQGKKHLLALHHDDVSPKKRKVDTTACKKPFWAPKTLRSNTVSHRLYDKVLVDAECTHDGSISHILKYEKWGWDAFERNFMDSDRLDTICQLQRDLMEQGWSLLRKKGYMVYSTCSLTIKQNEENVAWFLEKHPEAILEQVPVVADMGVQLAKVKKATERTDIQKQMDTYCVRFDPLISRTSGFFLAKFRKES